ncbi:pentapeptide repeat-containing protein [Saccharopolyspora hordei]|nr:pentapeptide repeat-containing protein [Saccharopolyspora hordei]
MNNCRLASTNFSEAHLARASFVGTEFMKPTSFKKATFDFGAPFDYSTFAEEVAFDDAKFNGRAGFARVKFLDHADFDRVHFSSSFDLESSFFHTGISCESAKFDKRGRLALNKTQFGGYAWFEDVEISAASAETKGARVRIDVPDDAKRDRIWLLGWSVREPETPDNGKISNREGIWGYLDSEPLPD